MILNLTQHPATAEQKAAGVVDLPVGERTLLQQFLTFEELPSADEIQFRAEQIAILARAAFHRLPDLDAVMIGGAPFLMGPLEREFFLEHALDDEAASDPPFRPRVLYAFSQRESIEEKQEDGSIRKVNVFRHAGFVEAKPEP
jgi:hypothetical protein